MMTTTETTIEMLGVLKNRESQTKDYQKFPKKIQELMFRDVDAKYHNRKRKMFALFADM